MVDTDRVGADGLHEGRVETTLCRVDEGIVGYQLVGDTCRLWSVAVLVADATALKPASRLSDRN